MPKNVGSRPAVIRKCPPRRLHLFNIWLSCNLSAWLPLLLSNWRQLGTFRDGAIAGILLATATLNSLLGWLQRTVVALSGSRSILCDDPVFVLGHWRSGTTILHRLLAKDPQFSFPSNYVCFCPGHFLLTEWLLSDGFETVAPVTRLIDEMPLDADEPQEDEFALLGIGAPSPYRQLAFPMHGLAPADSIRRVLDDPLQRKRWQRAMQRLVASLTCRDRRRLLLKSPGHSLRWQSLLEMYPGARLIVMTRERQATIDSTVRMWQFLCSSQSFCDLDASSLETQVATTFDAVAQELQRAEQQVPACQLIVVDLAELIQDPLRQVRRIYDQLQLGEFPCNSPITIQLLQSIKHHQLAG